MTLVFICLLQSSGQKTVIVALLAHGGTASLALSKYDHICILMKVICQRYVQGLYSVSQLANKIT